MTVASHLEVFLARASGHGGKLLGPMSGVLGVDDLGEEELGKRLGFRERGAGRNRRTEDGHLFRAAHGHLVLGVLGARVEDADDDEHVLELGADVARSERLGSGLLEDDRDDVVANVPLAEELLPIVGREGQEG